MPDSAASLDNPAHQPDEATLIDRVRNGEHDLFYELIRPYERNVYRAQLVRERLGATELGAD